jgi:hypothetical protein
MKTLEAKFKGYWITIEPGHETVYAHWCNDETSQNRRFSGYSMREILAIIKREINQ